MSQSAAADPVLFWTQHRSKAAPDIDPLPWISVTGFRNPGKDQQLELNLGRAWIPERPGTIAHPFPNLSAALVNDSHPLAPWQQETLRLLISPTSILNQRERHCTCHRSVVEIRWQAPRFHVALQQSAGLSNEGPSTPRRCTPCTPLLLFNAGYDRGCWIGTSLAHNRGTEPVGGKQESTNGLIRIPSA